MKILHISDLHFGDEKFEGDDSTLINKMNSIDADFVLSTGDLTNKGKEEEFKEYCEFISKINLPILSIRGNHDRVLRKKSDEYFVKYLGNSFIDDLYVFAGEDGTHVIGHVESCFGFGEVNKYRKHNGRVNQNQIDRLFKKMDGIESVSRSLVLHHSPIFTDSCPLENSDFVKSIATRNGIDYIINGHTHISSFDNINHLGYYNNESNNHSFWNLNCGTTRSTNYKFDGQNNMAIYDMQKNSLSINLIRISHKNGKSKFTEISILE